MALGVRLAQDFKRKGYRIWANIDVEDGEFLDSIFALDPAEDACVILENAGLQLYDEKRADALLDRVSSGNIIVLMPSAPKPFDYLRSLECFVTCPWPKWYIRCLPNRWHQKGLECHWRIPRATYPGSEGMFRWRSPVEVYHLYDCRDPGGRTYMDG